MGEIRDVYEITSELASKIKKFFKDKQQQKKVLGYSKYFDVFWEITLVTENNNFEVDVSQPRCPECKTELHEHKDSDDSGYNFWVVYDCPNPECEKISGKRFEYDLTELKQRIAKTERMKIEETLNL